MIFTGSQIGITIRFRGYIFLHIDCHDRHGHNNSECRSFASNLSTLLSLSLRKLCWSAGETFFQVYVDVHIAKPLRKLWIAAQRVPAATKPDVQEENSADKYDTRMRWAKSLLISFTLSALGYLEFGVSFFDWEVHVAATVILMGTVSMVGFFLFF